MVAPRPRSRRLGSSRCGRGCSGGHSPQLAGLASAASKLVQAKGFSQALARAIEWQLAPHAEQLLSRPEQRVVGEEHAGPHSRRSRSTDCDQRDAAVAVSRVRNAVLTNTGLALV